MIGVFFKGETVTLYWIKENSRLIYTGFQKKKELQHIFKFCYFYLIPLDGCVFSFGSVCHCAIYFFLFLEYQRSWNGLMIATMWKFIFWKYVLLNFC